MSASDPPATAASTADLLARAREGDEQGWSELVARHARLVLAIPRERGLSREDCEEVFQATWIALHRQIELIRNPATITAWIVTTARRQTWRILRQRSARDTGGAPSPELPGDELDPAEEAERLERRGIVHAALARLSARCKKLLELLYLRTPAASYQEAATELGSPIGSIGPTRLRCLARLARLVESHPGLRL